MEMTLKFNILIVYLLKVSCTSQYPSEFPFQLNPVEPYLANKITSAVPSFSFTDDSLDPGGYVYQIYDYDLSLSSPPFNLFESRWYDHYSYVIYGNTASTFPPFGVDIDYWNCTISDYFIDSSFFEGSSYCSECCAPYYGLPFWFPKEDAQAYNKVLTTFLDTGLCVDFNEDLYCQATLFYGLCQDNLLSLTTRKIVLSCFDYFIYYFMSSCPAYKTLGLWSLVSMFETPMFILTANIYDSLILKSLDFTGNSDKICLPYSYFNAKISPISSAYISCTIVLFVFYVALTI